MTRTAWVPHESVDAAAAALGGIPEGLRVVPFPDADQLPEDPALVEFLVQPYFSGARALARVDEMVNLEVVQLQSAGYEDVLPAVPEGVRLANGRGVHDTATAEIALGLMIAHGRNIDVAARNQSAGRWEPMPGRSIADKHILLVGPGNIGRAIQQRLEVFEPASITLVARTARDGIHAFTDLDDLLPKADIVVLACPLTDDTRHLIDAERLALLHDDALVVNVARGPVVDTDALIAENGRIGAAMDVVDPEPLPPEHPLWTVPRVLISPHVGGMADCFERRRDKLLAASLRAWLAGERLPAEIDFAGSARR